MTPDGDFKMQLIGTVASGRGWGGTTVASNQERIEELLGEAPFPGTLNVLLDDPVFFRSNEHFGSKPKEVLIPAQINGTKCLIYRWRRAPAHIAEIIAATSLRDLLGLEEGQRIKLSLPGRHVKKLSYWRYLLWSAFYKKRPHLYYEDDLLIKPKGTKLLYRLACQYRFK